MEIKINFVLNSILYKIIPFTKSHSTCNWLVYSLLSIVVRNWYFWIKVRTIVPYNFAWNNNFYRYSNSNILFKVESTLYPRLLLFYLLFTSNLPLPIEKITFESIFSAILSLTIISIIPFEGENTFCPQLLSPYLSCQSKWETTIHE